MTRRKTQESQSANPVANASNERRGERVFCFLVKLSCAEIGSSGSFVNSLYVYCSEPCQDSILTEIKKIAEFFTVLDWRLVDPWVADASHAGYARLCGHCQHFYACLPGDSSVNADLANCDYRPDSALGRCVRSSSLACPSFVPDTDCRF